MVSLNESRRWRQARRLAFIVAALSSGISARAQSLSVLPVNIFLAPGQRATTLTVTNHGTTETAIQIRGFAWSQKDGADQLVASDNLVLSPPLATIPAGATQVVRLILRQPPQGQESTYRIWVDQIPPPAEAGIVHIVLRLSIPIFAQPAARAVPHVRYHLEREKDHVFLVGVNDGLHHEVVRDIVLTTSDGRKLKEQSSASPYILAGATRRWPLDAQGSLPQAGESLRLTAHAESGAIDEQISTIAIP
ncbi:MAG: fimbria/pilus periplasmic chaperone [Acidobacteriota bacterium]